MPRGRIPGVPRRPDETCPVCGAGPGQRCRKKCGDARPPHKMPGSKATLPEPRPRPDPESVVVRRGHQLSVACPIYRHMLCD